jgi:uncharacterized protein
LSGLRHKTSSATSQPEVEDRLTEGIRLFNCGSFFEAHEVWEQEWKKAEGIERIFLQGIIQSAAAMHHIQRGNYAGALSVYLKSCSKLANFPEVWMGIELGQFRSELRQYFATLRAASDIRGGNGRAVEVEEAGRPKKPPTIKWVPK